MREKDFINRTEEMALLIETLKHLGPELIIIYGRRRIGKSRLLKEVSKIQKIDFYIMLEELDYNANLRKASRIIGDQYKLPSFYPVSFKELFKALKDNCIIIFDEFSYLQNGFGEFQDIWEEIAKPKNIKIILCGSLINVMEDLTYSLTSPLYGRATKIIKVLPLRLAAVYEWYRNEGTLEQILPIYFILGGIPRYLELISTPNLDEIKSLFFSKDGLLLREGKLLLKESFPSSLIIPKILFAVASGTTEASKIANEVQLKPSEISKYLTILCDYGFISKKYPILHPGKKSVRFYPSDSFFAFWTRFVWQFYNDIDAGAITQAISHFNQHLTTYQGHRFENMILDYIREATYLHPFSIELIGAQWGRIPDQFHPEKSKDQYEIDLCAINNHTKEILLGECKWQDDVNAVEICSELIKKAQYLEWNNEDRKEYLMVFAKHFYTRISKFNGITVRCVDVDDLSALLIQNERK